MGLSLSGSEPKWESAQVGVQVGASENAVPRLPISVTVNGVDYGSTTAAVQCVE